MTRRTAEAASSAPTASARRTAEIQNAAYSSRLADKTSGRR
jgi:hypothetical protein